MHRLIVTSSAYRMSSVPDGEAERLDPENALLHRMNVRRLEAEAIRDALLSLSGRLSSAMYGPSVPVHLTAFMDGRGRPRHSGPLDGDGRRSLYLGVRRNFLNPMFLAFDAPVAVLVHGPPQRLERPRPGPDPPERPAGHRAGEAMGRADPLRPRPATTASASSRPSLSAFGRPPTDQETQGLPRLPRPRRLGRPLPCADQYERVYLHRLR